MTLARSLERDWTGEGETSGAGKREMWRGGDEGLAADFDYVMFGKVSLSRNLGRRTERGLGEGGACVGYATSRRPARPGQEM